MIEQNKIFRIISYLILISLIFGLLSFLKIQYQFYVWEILIDLKIVAVFGLFYLSYRKKELIFVPSQLSFFSFDWKQNILLFFVPLCIYAVTIGIGIASSEVKINKMDNAATLVLATIFDIPAIYVFSITSIFIEELIFRGILLKSFERSFGVFRSIFLTSTIWAIFMLTDIVGTETIDLSLSGIFALFFLSLGILLSIVSLWKGNVWLGYSLRIGLITITPIVLISRINESDSFFTTDSMFYTAEGLIVTLTSGVIAMIIYLKSGRKLYRAIK